MCEWRLQACELAKHAQDSGADATSAVPFVDGRVYGNFDIVVSSSMPPPPRAVQCVLMCSCAHADWVLPGACNPMVRPTHVGRYKGGEGNDFETAMVHFRAIGGACR